MDRTNNISNNCEHPNQVRSAMRQMMKMTTARIRAEYITDLLKQLMNLELGTSEITIKV